MSIGIFELVNGVLTKKKIAGKTLMDAQLNANSRNGVQNRIITGEINDIKDDISTINTHLSSTRFNVNPVSISQTDFVGYGIYDKATNTVRIYVASKGTSLQSTSIAIIPDAYKPATNAPCIGSINGNVTANIYVGTNGVVVQGYTSTYDSALVIAEYSLS